MSRRNGALLLALSAIWGSSFLFIKLGVDELEPSVVALGRLVVGAAILLPIAASRGGLGLLRPYLAIVAALGLLNNALPFWLLGFAETRISSGLAGVIQAAAPIFTVLLAIRLDPTQRATGIRLAGIGVGFVGVALLVGVQSGGELVGALAVLAAALCYAVVGPLRREAGRRDPAAPPRRGAARGRNAADGAVRPPPAPRRGAPGEDAARDRRARLARLRARLPPLLRDDREGRCVAGDPRHVPRPGIRARLRRRVPRRSRHASAVAGLALVLAGTTLATGVARLRAARGLA